MNIQPFSKTYGTKTVLQFPEAALEPGKIHMMLGANGSGKSTAAKILAGVVPSDQKRAPFAGRCSIGYLPQKSYRFRMSTRANILLGGRDKARAGQLMQTLKLEHLAKQNAKLLSGGESARMALARLMMKTYDLIILDEPTAAMDMESTIVTERLVREYCSSTNCAVLFISHSLQQARRIGDTVFFLAGGAVVEHGDAVQVLESPREVQTREFLDFYGV